MFGIDTKKIRQAFTEYEMNRNALRINPDQPPTAEQVFELVDRLIMALKEAFGS